MTSNTFYHYLKLRRHWNDCLNKLGYVDRCIVNNPNSTDIHSVKNIKNFSVYLCSYFTKKDNYTRPLKRFHRLNKKKLLNYSGDSYLLPRNYIKYLKRNVSCKLWDCSKELKKSVCRIQADDPVYTDEIKALNDKRIEWNKYDYCRVLYLEPFALDALPNLSKLLKSSVIINTS